MKIALLLPAGFNMGHLRKARSLAEAAAHLCSDGPRPVSIAIGLPQPDQSLWRQQEGFLKTAAPSVTVRHLSWEKVPSANALRMFSRTPCPHNLDGLDHVLVPRDWGANFTDCDVWFNLAEPGMGAVCTLRPTAHFCSGLLAREFPYAVANTIHADYWARQTAAFRLWRQWSVVVTTDPALPEALTSYAGIHPDKVTLLPSLIDPPVATDHMLGRIADRLLWRVEPSAGHDLAAALQGLDLYRDRGGQLMPMIACEMPPSAFGKESNIADIAALSPPARVLLDELPAIQIPSSKILANALQRSSFLWSSNLTDGEGQALFEGANFGLHMLVADTRANRLAAARAGGSAIYHLPGDAESIADALSELETSIGKPAIPAQVAVRPQTRATHIGFVVDRLLEMAGD